jgi:hypothetical protein
LLRTHRDVLARYVYISPRNKRDILICGMLALGAFLATSESEAADVECFASESDSQPFNMPGCEQDPFSLSTTVLTLS